jgi:hypothetical protein
LLQRVSFALLLWLLSVLLLRLLSVLLLRA